MALTNEDFKALLLKPRQEAPAKERSVPDISVKKPKWDPQKKEKKKQKSADYKARLEEHKERDTRYRDRAEERRRLDPSYTPSARSKQAVPANQPKSSDVAVLGEATGLEADNSHISIEKSKYLGGDVKYTHLVKGLDYALLEKIKSQLEKEGDPKKEPQPEEHQITRSLVPTIRTAVAERIQKLLFERTAKPIGTELFLPRRMGFMYEWGNEDEVVLDSDTPTTKLRSKAECPQPIETLSAGCPEDVLDKINRVFSNSKGGHKKRKRKDDDATHHPIVPEPSIEPPKQPQESAPLAAPPKPTVVVAPFEDMFESSGTQAATKSSSGLLKPSAKTYFNPRSEEPDQAEEERKAAESLDMINRNLKLAEARKKFEDSQRQYAEYQQARRSARPEGAAAIFHNVQDPASRKRGREAQRLGLAYDGDYGEETYDAGPTGFEDSDEEDAPRPEEGKKVKGAAVEGEEGRTTKRQLEKKEQQKLSSELQKINQILEKRKRGDRGGGDEEDNKRPRRE